MSPFKLEPPPLVKLADRVDVIRSEGRLGNLWASMLNYAGCPVESFADSDGLLTDIFA